jgi:hypothetical protein
MFGSKNNNILKYDIILNNEAIVLERVCLVFRHSHHILEAQLPIKMAYYLLLANQNENPD